MTSDPPTAHEAARLAWDADRAMARGDLQNAERLYRTAIDIFQAHESRRGVAGARTGLGAALHAQGRLDEALEVTSAALAEHQALSDRRSAGITLNNLGVIQLGRGDRDAAAIALFEALELLDAEGESRRALEARLNLASLHHEAGRLEEAQALAEQGARTARAIMDLRAEGIALSGTAAILVERVARGDYSVREQGRTIVSLYERAAHLHEEAGQPVEEAHARVGLAAWDLERGGYASAISQLTVARDRYQQAGDRGGLGLVMALLAVPEAAGGRVEASRRALTEAAPLVANDLPRQTAVQVLLAAVALAACRGRPNDELREAERAARERVLTALAPLEGDLPSLVRSATRISTTLLGRDVFGPLLLQGGEATVTLTRS